MNLKTIKKTFILMCVIIMLTSLFLHNSVQANNFNNEIFEEEIAIEEMIVEDAEVPNASTRALYPDRPEISGRPYYIKNMMTGQYLDVQNGVAANGTNVWQYKFNGSLAQQWYIHSYGDGTYSLLTPLGNDGSYVYALDISQGSSANYANVQIYKYNGTDAQKFSIGRTAYDTYAIFSKCSNFEKAVVLNGPTCDQGRNVDQYTFQMRANETWILEPVARHPEDGVRYATMNYQQYVPAYPNLTTFKGETADCANFVSQCLIASGVHYEGDWKIYRKNFTTNQPTNTEELDNTWELCAPKASPWVSAAEFCNYWGIRANKKIYTAQYILDHPLEIFQENYFAGDVVQVARNTLGYRGDAEHTMFITGYNAYNGNQSFTLTYHSYSTKDKNLLEICQGYINQGINPYIIFYEI